MATTRWVRDVGIEEMIAHFDQPSRHNSPHALTSKEIAAIRAEVDQCQNSFEYAARNYFMIQNKRGQDILFKLWESQELILERLYAMKERKRAQKILLLKSRQLGASTLIEALIAWRTIFFPNINALVVSVDEKHTAELFGKMLHIYDMLPWWLRPMVAARKYEEGIWFANPDSEERRLNPGMNSKVSVQHSTQMSGIGQGITLQACHVSEFSDWFPPVAERTIEGDLAYALAETEETFAVLESTGRGAGSYAEKLWKVNVELAEKAAWSPVFLPWFFEKTRVMAPEDGWAIHTKEQAVSERIASEWVRCSKCGYIAESVRDNVNISGKSCAHCATGILDPYRLSDEQSYWLYVNRLNAEKKGIDSLRQFLQEIASTPEDCFQLKGVSVFPDECQQYVNDCIRRPIAIGKLDNKGNFHAVINHQTHRCYQEWCDRNHQFDDDQYLRIWEYPEPKSEYVIGVDVADGLGDTSVEANYQAAFVNRVGRAGNPDRQVALLRSNTIDAISFAKMIIDLGYWYNTAMLAIEYNRPTTADYVHVHGRYPNLFQWKRYDSTRNIVTNRLHWLTQPNTKPRLWETARSYLRAHLWEIRSSNFHSEMRTFQKEDLFDKKAGAMRGYFDDELLSGMIALFCSHDTDMDSFERPSELPKTPEEELQEKPWRMRCQRCQFTWGAENPGREGYCPSCGSIQVCGKPQTSLDISRTIDFDEMLRGTGGGMGAYMEETDIVAGGQK